MFGMSKRPPSAGKVHDVLPPIRPTSATKADAPLALEETTKEQLVKKENDVATIDEGQVTPEGEIVVLDQNNETTETLLEEISLLKLPENDFQECKKIVIDNPQLGNALLAGIKCVKYLLTETDETLKDSLQVLNLQFFSVEQKDRATLGDFLSFTEFPKWSFVKYKSILKNLNADHFNDSFLMGEDNTSVDQAQCLFLLRTHWWNFSDASLAMGGRLSNHGLIQELVQDISNLVGTNNQELNISFSFESAIGTLHNIAKVPNLRHIFRNVNAVEISAKFLNYTDLPNILMLVLLTLALIIDDDQTHLLISHESVFDLILRLAKTAWKTKEHRFDGFSLEELVQGLCGLSKNDEVKKLLCNKGVLKLVSDMLSQGTSREKVVAAGLLWELSFDDDNKKLIKSDPSMIENVKELSKESNKDLARSCQGVLWVLTMEEETKHIAGLQEREKASGPMSEGSPGHIMISYNWADQKKILEIKEHLQANGYKVWMDVDNIRGSTLQAMAEAVENSVVVLICASEKYKESLNCRSEAEYAFNLKKPVVPLLMQFKYKPDGWLGILFGSKLFYDFSGKYEFEKKIKELMEAIGERGKVHSTTATTDEVDGPIRKEIGSIVGRPPQPEPTSTFKVADWLTEKNLGKHKFLQNMNSEQLRFLKKLSLRAPEFYYSLVMDMITSKATVDDVASLLNITDAVESIPR